MKLEALSPTRLAEWLESNWGIAPAFSRGVLIMLAAIIAAWLTNLIITRVVFRIAARTRSDLDDRIMSLLHRPIFYSVLLIGLNSALKGTLNPRVDGSYFHTNLIETLTVLLWLFVAVRIGTLILNEMAIHESRFNVVQPSTLPIFNMGWKLLVVGGAAYFLIEAWDYDPTPWMASAGVIGITLGFAARDTIANLFAGIFILADAPYKIGDYIVLDSGERGKVTRIGIRSTRLLTRDDVEITIPNAVIADAKIVNESGGPYIKYRTRIPVGVAYGSDIDLVRRCLLEVAADDPEVSKEPAARVRFREFGDSSLNFELLCWIDDPEWRGRVKDRLFSNVYKAFTARGIEIPYPKRDLYIKREGSKSQENVGTDE